VLGAGLLRCARNDVFKHLNSRATLAQIRGNLVSAKIIKAFAERFSERMAPAVAHWVTNRSRADSISLAETSFATKRTSPFCGCLMVRVTRTDSELSAATVTG
jgi:hypothetical protein